MAYYLAVERTPDSYEAINFKKTTKGKELFSNQTYESTLKEIDEFTTQYPSLDKLKYELHSEKKLPWSTSAISIIHVDGIEITIKNGILFSNSQKYVQNPNLIYDYIIAKYINKDIVFFSQLANVLGENTLVKDDINILINKLAHCIAYDYKPTQIDATHAAELLIYNVDSKGKVNTSLEVNYEQVHKMIVFINNYEGKLTLDNQQTKTRRRTKNT